MPGGLATEVRGRLAALTSRQRTMIAVAVVAGVVALPLRGLLRRQGGPMEEGFMLVFPVQLLHGQIPNRDFLHLYGPGAIWVLAGAFKTFGVTLFTERAVALLQLLGIIFGVFLLLLRPFGRILAALGSALTAFIILPPLGLAALAWNGGVALGLFGAFTGVASTRASTRKGANGFALASGALFGGALLYRLDLVLATALVVIVLFPRLTRAARGRLLAAGGLTVSLYLVQVAMAGFHNSVQGMIINPIFDLRGGRRLPFPPNPHAFDGFLIATGERDALHWPIPNISSPAQLTIWFFVLLGTVAFLAGVAWLAWRRDRGSLRTLTLLVGAAFSLGILPQALQRADTAHLSWVSCVPFGFLPVATVEFVRILRPRWSRLQTLLVGIVPLFLSLFLIIPNWMVRDYVEISAETFGIHRKSYPIENEGRLFYAGRPEVATVLRSMLPVVDRISKPGQRLFVGTGDLRKTPYSDAFLYWLLPQLKPATYYIEMDPGVANAKGSRLAKDVASADFVILSRVWDIWNEPNDSRVVGPEAPNQVLKQHFCTVRDDGFYVLLQRCAHGNAPVP